MGEEVGPRETGDDSQNHAHHNAEPTATVPGHSGISCLVHNLESEVVHNLLCLCLLFSKFIIVFVFPILFVLQVHVVLIALVLVPDTKSILELNNLFFATFR